MFVYKKDKDTPLWIGSIDCHNMPKLFEPHFLLYDQDTPIYWALCSSKCHGHYKYSLLNIVRSCGWGVFCCWTDALVMVLWTLMNVNYLYICSNNSWVRHTWCCRRLQRSWDRTSISMAHSPASWNRCCCLGGGQYLVCWGGFTCGYVLCHSTCYTNKQEYGNGTTILLWKLITRPGLCCPTDYKQQISLKVPRTDFLFTTPVLVVLVPPVKGIADTPGVLLDTTNWVADVATVLWSFCCCWNMASFCPYVLTPDRLFVFTFHDTAVAWVGAELCAVVTHVCDANLWVVAAVMLTTAPPLVPVVLTCCPVVLVSGWLSGVFAVGVCIELWDVPGGA